MTTLRRWECEGKLFRKQTGGGHGRYDLAKLGPERVRSTSDMTRKTLADARVSSHDQNEDLERQTQQLARYWARQGGTLEVVADPRSGMNYHKKGL
ncbi:recombinase family protein [Sulfobacillus harzensis]|uniref:Resolvase/invertase-type recombinase catalytic domain-containing protein n=1 Tax=Sulfobacillus harzensis TaxID=2729629 RepID=A0A7Y0L7S8_9FIRM|nr:recombinase family protein [Sulfobacillus harzensis]NMP24893.1 hypothetical protein [Sulfobacillus harzensis]